MDRERVTDDPMPTDGPTDHARMRYLTTERAAALLTESTGVRVAKSTVWRWCVHGVDGVRLRHVKLGRRFMTTEKWLNEFMAAGCGPDHGRNSPISVHDQAAETHEAAEAAGLV